MPTFEREADREREQAVADVLAKFWGVTVHRYEEHSPLDFWFSMDHVVLGFGEYKRRFINSDTYDEVFLSKRKYDALAEIGKTAGKPALFIVEFNDSLCYINVKDVDPSNSCVAGRTDRGAVNDVEPMYLVPIEEMTIVLCTAGD